MRDELKYPIVFALQKMTKEAYENYNSFDEILGYVVSPCYLIEENLLYDKDGNSCKKYKVVFPRSVDSIYYDYIDRDYIPDINSYGECKNAVTVDFITYRGRCPQPKRGPQNMKSSFYIQNTLISTGYIVIITI